MAEDNNDRRRWTGLLSFMNLSFYLGAVVVLSVGGSYWVGRLLDQRLQKENVYTILLLIMGGALAFYLIIRRLMEIGKGTDRWRR
jgi:hypothetical protein